VDWDAIAGEYHRHVLSPFAPEMAGRNPLVAELLEMPLEELDIVDLGCGPGNLIPHLGGRVSRLVGVDLSASALALASEVGRDHGVVFDGYCGDWRTIELYQTFDVAVSVNSVLPPTRDEVVALFAAMARVLEPGGRLLAILPSFDTTRYLRGLIAGRDGERVAAAWDARHLVDETSLLFADDGVTRQAYHTPESMQHELSRAGLRVVREPVKVRYPWELTARFDYGDFPDAPEEVWDWYVVVQSQP
jgi:SAM-dependent methyltransferase